MYQIFFRQKDMGISLLDEVKKNYEVEELEQILVKAIKIYRGSKPGNVEFANELMETEKT